MKTTTAQVEEYLIDCKGYGDEEVQEMLAEWGNDLEGFLRSNGADDDVIQDVKGFFK